MQDIEDDFKANGGSFKNYKLGDLFYVKSNPQLNKESFVFSNDGVYPYFTRTVLNNGILGYVEYLDEGHKIKGNSIAVGMLGMQFFYMATDFYAGQFTKTIFPKFSEFNEKLALYFIGIFNKQSQLLKSMLVRNFEKIFTNTTVNLPTRNNKIDFSYMEKYISELEKERIRELKKERISELENYLKVSGLNDYNLTPMEEKALNCMQNGKVNFKEFKIDELLRLQPVNNKLTKLDLSNNGNIPVLSSDTLNNGIVGYTDKTPDFTINRESPIYLIFGDHTRSMNIMDKEFCVTDNVKVLIPIINNIECILFINTLWKKMIPNLGYARHWKIAKNSIVKLPINSKKEIDYNFMNTYIKAIEKIVIKHIIDCKDKIIQKTKEIVINS